MSSASQSQSSTTDRDDYRSVCDRAARTDLFHSFKRDYAYRLVLEHVSPDEGREFLRVTMRDQPQLLASDASLRAIKCNDMLGGADRVEYGTGLDLSPSTLRYAKCVSDLLTLFGQDALQQPHFRVVEIGAGYGGQILLLALLFPAMQFTVYDLPEAMLLQRRYLSAHGVLDRVEFRSLDDPSEHDRFELVISNFALSECTAEIQRRYLTEIVQRCARGYFMLNQGGDGLKRLEIDELADLMIPDALSDATEVRFRAEEPLTGPGNVIAHFSLT